MAALRLVLRRQTLLLFCARKQVALREGVNYVPKLHSSLTAGSPTVPAIHPALTGCQIRWYAKKAKKDKSGKG